MAVQSVSGQTYQNLLAIIYYHQYVTAKHTNTPPVNYSWMLKILKINSSYQLKCRIRTSQLKKRFFFTRCWHTPRPILYGSHQSTIRQMIKLSQPINSWHYIAFIKCHILCRWYYPPPFVRSTLYFTEVVFWGPTSKISTLFQEMTWRQSIYWNNEKPIHWCIDPSPCRIGLRVASPHGWTRDNLSMLQ